MLHVLNRSLKFARLAFFPKRYVWECPYPIKPPNGRYKDPLDVNIKDNLPDEYWVESEPRPRPNSSKLVKVVQELQEYNDEWKVRELPIKFQEFVLQTKMLAEDAVRIEERNKIETNTGHFKHHDRWFLLPKPEKGPKSPLVPYYPDPSQPAYEEINLYKRQERLRIDHNYNFEQYRNYTQLLSQKQKEDAQNVLEHRKLMKYLKKTETKQADSYLKRIDMHRGVLRENPEDADLDISDVKLPKQKKPKKTINERRKGDLKTYSAWRNFERDVLLFRKTKRCHAVLELVPALLIKAFGFPEIDNCQEDISGQYIFEDVNHDIFVLYEFKQTTLFHGDNFPLKSYYELNEKRSKLRKEEILKKTIWPDPSVFWSTEYPKEFRLIYPPYADYRLFRQFLESKIEQAKNDKESYKDKLIKKFGPLALFDNYDEKYKINTEYTVYKHDYKKFLTKDELKDYDFSDLPEISIFYIILMEF